MFRRFTGHAMLSASRTFICTIPEQPFPYLGAKARHLPGNGWIQSGTRIRAKCLRNCERTSSRSSPPRFRIRPNPCGNGIFLRPTAIILGNEHEGVEEDLLAHADGEIYIPMLGMIQSLNVSRGRGSNSGRSRKAKEWRPAGMANPEWKGKFIRPIWKTGCKDSFASNSALACQTAMAFKALADGRYFFSNLPFSHLKLTALSRECRAFPFIPENRPGHHAANIQADQDCGLGIAGKLAAFFKNRRLPARPGRQQARAAQKHRFSRTRLCIPDHPLCRPR